jgi:hypothetical protein
MRTEPDDRITLQDGTLSFPVGRLELDEMRAISAYIQQIYDAAVRDAHDPDLVGLNRSLLVLNDIETTVAYMGAKVDR